MSNKKTKNHLQKIIKRLETIHLLYWLTEKQKTSRCRRSLSLMILLELLIIDYLQVKILKVKIAALA